jgi:hypothetical protein
MPPSEPCPHHQELFRDLVENTTKLDRILQDLREIKEQVAHGLGAHAKRISRIETEVEVWKRIAAMVAGGLVLAAGVGQFVVHFMK